MEVYTLCRGFKMVNNAKPITAFGRHWKFRKREESTGELLGVRQGSGDPVNMANQAGIYILYDRGRAVYVGKTEQNGLIDRLREHRKGKKWERWDRFSWYGIRPVDRETGRLGKVYSGAEARMVIDVMESVLIETLTPYFNGRSGSSIGEMYVQVRARIKRA
ncbi:MAG: GIY-YIG nuclease family protein [Alphaproteobacteria bacterium]|nr:GIY-YIG nuclease family protein [Alphaproteobacteria bacterium]